MKKCTRCNTPKHEDEFGWKNKDKGTKHARCKSCMREVSNLIYANSDSRRNKIKLNTKEQIKSNKEFARRYKQFVGCAHCKKDEVKKYYLLDFHHLSDKDDAVSRMLGRGRNIFKNEIRKCIVLCALCHREEHHRLNLV